MVNYSDSTTQGVQRAGANPLTVQAYLQGDCDVVVSDEDAQKILAANQKSKILQNCKVVFVK
jgi:ABC-type amino acid transport substrate-binding protein